MRNRITNWQPRRLDTERPTLVSVISGKGGVGKSVLAYNTAHLLAEQGYETVLLDLDQACGNQHILANVTAEFGLPEFVSGKLSLNEAITRVNEHLSLLPSMQSNPEQQVSTAQAAARLVQKIRSDAKRYDFVVIDHGSGISEVSTVMAHGSDLSLVVTIPELTSIADAYGLCKYLHSKNTRISAPLLLNRIASQDEADYVADKFSALSERFLHWSPGLAGVISEDITIRRAIGSQMPIAAVNPEAPSLGGLRRLIEVLTGRSQDQSYSEPGINEFAATADTRG